MTLSQAQQFKMPFGKYKTRTLQDILEENHKYLIWVYRISTSPNLSDACAILLKYIDAEIEIPDNKIEQIVKECIMHRGYSEAEANVFMRKLKTI